MSENVTDVLDIYPCSAVRKYHTNTIIHECAETDRIFRPVQRSFAQQFVNKRYRLDPY